MITSTNNEVSELSSDDGKKPAGKKARKYNDFNPIDYPTPVVSKELTMDVNVKMDFLKKKK